jgi:uncharacterized OsmC-like protein
MGYNRQAESHDHAALSRRLAADTAQREGESDAPAPHPLVALQQQVGNAQVARMLAQREGEEEEEVQAQHDLSQREDEEEEEVQAKPEVGLEGGPLSPELSGRINSQRGGGAALDGGTRASMEGAFGADFEGVRVHTDAESDALNRSISARAFTTGSDIFFRNDAGPGDHSLLAHELTHVVQQRSGVGGGGGGMTVGPAGDSHEQQADAAATAVTSGAAAQAQREADEQQAQRMLVQREGEMEEEEPTV